VERNPFYALFFLSTIVHSSFIDVQVLGAYNGVTE